MTGEIFTVTVASVEMHELPDADAQKLATLPRGHAVTRLDDRLWNQTWMRVEATVGDRRYHGYVPSQALAQPRPEPAAPAIDAARLERQMQDTLRGYGRRAITGVLSRQRKALIAALAPKMAAQFPEHGVTTPLRQAHFIAQTAVETDFYNTLREYGDDARFARLYDNRRDLGNNQPGDGARFKGRGLIQLTGRDNYTRASQALGLGDRLVEHPHLVETDLTVSVSAALWYWTKNKINAVSERSGSVESVTRAVSRAVNRGNPDHTGQPNGWNHRRLATLAAYEVFGVRTA